MADYPSLATEQRAVYRLTPDLLLVFKPRGHSEELHAHPHRQRLRVVRGSLRVRTARSVITLGPGSPALTLAPRRRHATEALADTWLVAETVLPARRRLPLPRRRP